MIGTIVSSVIMSTVAFYIWNYFSSVKFDWRNKRTILLVVITSFATLINYFNTSFLLKIMNIVLIFIVIYKFLFQTNLKNSIAGPIILEFIYVVSETIFFSFMAFIFKSKTEEILNTYSAEFIANVIISGLAILISRLSFIKKIYNSFNDNIIRIDEFVVITLSFFTLFIYSFFTANVYYGVDSRILVFISMLTAILAFSLVFVFFKAKDDYYKMVDKYNSSILSLKEFEDVLNSYRVDNHENKNHLLAIRNMTKNKKVISFIDTILDNKEKDNSNLMHETSIIPSGGLRGLIYSKMLVMKNKDIECELDVDRKVRTIDLLDYGDDTLLDICKIIGIFLDNAIEEVETLEEKYIIIEMFIEDKILKISITNIFDTSIDKKDIYKVGYSTKGDKHGYGLSLVKKLTNKNNKLRTHHEINDDEFTQVLEILK